MLITFSLSSRCIRSIHRRSGHWACPGGGSGDGGGGGVRVGVCGRHCVGPASRKVGACGGGREMVKK